LTIDAKNDDDREICGRALRHNEVDRQVGAHLLARRRPVGLRPFRLKERTLERTWAVLEEALPDDRRLHAVLLLEEFQIRTANLPYAGFEISLKSISMCFSVLLGDDKVSRCPTHCLATRSA
jgi:hypothetical protein